MDCFKKPELRLPVKFRGLTVLFCMAGTTGLEPATSAVTVNRECVTYSNQEARMARFSSLRHPWERLLWTYCAHDLCPVDLCPIDAFTPPELSVMRGAIFGI